ncbi:mycofactocin biosynthesis glycosyltransferase MftF [Nocardia mexicana]|uniref:Mycofactocin system glycosyltransferase n=1 Tax=Nocardia mexicana TaxID=279262 RepID=A0A370GMV3_9NOCA|nr:mycofactocin biosynthesis glycosyltransferase MftF [Nocardia mexicana]RDI45055.1 mycofactocin system glycosyltransferase [Nocardia mexicana]
MTDGKRTGSGDPPGPSAPLPEGVRVTLDPGVRMIEPHLWWGGSPARLLRLTPAGYAAWQQLRIAPVRGGAAAVLARRLTDSGFAHPRPRPRRSADLTVVVPVRDRPVPLARCLTALGDRYPVIVVDDGSADPASVAAVAAHHGATLLRHDRNRGPAAARNTALRRVRTELVAFVDSDCVPGGDWIARLAGHFDDPLVAAVAPRITALGPGPCGLDLGDRAARVVPNTPVAFVPTAALLARRGALVDIARHTAVFDPGLRFGEDVDLVWRLHEAGWRVRYDPGAVVAHEEPSSVGRVLARRFRYGTSAAPLAERHPDSLPPLAVPFWSAATVVALLGGRPLPAAAAFTASLLSNGATLRRLGAPPRQAVRYAVASLWHTGLAIGRYSTKYCGPLLLALAVTGRGPRTGRRLAIGALLLGPAVVSATDGRVHNPMREIADDIAYGCGVWVGCLRHRTVVPLRPRLTLARRSGREVSPKD